MTAFQPSSYTVKTTCPACKSTDCNDTVSTGRLVSFKLSVHEVFCNYCGEYSRTLWVDGKIVRHVTNVKER